MADPKENSIAVKYTSLCGTSARIGSPLIVYSFYGVANQKMKNFIEFSLSFNRKTK